MPGGQQAGGLASRTGRRPSFAMTINMTKFMSWSSQILPFSFAGTDLTFFLN
jgi:hypothetical protein